MNKSKLGILFLSVLIMLVLHQSITKHHFLKKTIMENVVQKVFSSTDSTVLSNTENKSNNNIPNNSNNFSSNVSSVSKANDVSDDPRIDSSIEEMESESYNQSTSHGYNYKIVSTKSNNANFTPTVIPDQSIDDLNDDTESGVKTYNEKRAVVKLTSIVDRVVDNKYSNKTSKPGFIPKHFSTKNNCQKIIVKYFNEYLDKTVLRILLKNCFKNEDDETKLILEKQFLRQFVGNISCPKIKPRYLEKTVPLVALASFPGSGNTWTRVLLERVTGIHTGSIYTDGMANFVGSKRCPTKGGVFIVKTHKQIDLVQRPGCPKNIAFSRAIFILRNPYDAILAEFNRNKGGKVGFAKQQAFSSNNWREFVMKCSERWKKMVLFWMKEYKKPVHVLVYEDLKSSTLLETYRLMNFLHVRVTLWTLYCLVNQPQGQYYRAAKPKWMIKSKLFDEKMIANIDANINFVRQQVDNSVENIFESYILTSKT